MIVPGRWRRGGEATAEAERGQLAPILIVTAELELSGYVAPTGQRITDMLLRGHDLAFLPAGAPEEPENWIRISPMEILFVAPPPLGATSAWHEDRSRREVSVRVGSYTVRGTAHVPPKSADMRELRSTQPFLPLTQARVRRAGGDDDESYDVVIVNLTWSTVSG